MGQNFQQVASRKENISAIEPLVSAMRTISLSQWRMALNRHETLESFLPLLDEAYAVLEANAGNAYTQSETTEKTLIILGSNRGLCGAFNKHLLRYARKKDMAATDFNEVYLTGNKLPALFKPMGFENMISLAFPDISAIPDAMQLFQLESIEQLTGKSIFILFNQYQGAGRYKTVSEQIYPQTTGPLRKAIRGIRIDHRHRRALTWAAAAAALIQLAPASHPVFLHGERTLRAFCIDGERGPEY